jgi:hypothetical protein
MMSGRTRHREGWLLLFTLFLVLVLGSGAASSAVGGPAGGHGGGPGRSGHGGGNTSRGRAFDGDRLDGRRFHQGRGGPEVFVFPYFYDPYLGYDPNFPGYDSYCDPYSPDYTPRYCYWDYAP